MYDEGLFVPSLMPSAGIENLNRVQGRLVRDITIHSRELLFKDPVSGAARRQ